MSRLPRALAPATAIVALAALAPAAHAASTATFPESGPTTATVQMTDLGPSSPTVHLVVTVADPAHLSSTHIFLGGDTLAPDVAIGTDGVHDARYDDNYDGELSSASCSIYDSTRTYVAPVATSADSFSADLPKGEVIAFEDTRVAVGDTLTDGTCDNGTGLHGVAIDYLGTKQTIDGFSWAAPAAPAVTATPGRRQVTLSFDRERGTQYDVYRVVGGVRDAAPFVSNVRGADRDVVIDRDDNGHRLDAGTDYRFQVQATRLFNVWNDARDDMYQPTSPFSATVSAAPAPVQPVRFLATPPASTTERTATLSWAIDGNDAGEAPFCVLDASAEVPCTTTGATLTGVALGAHTFAVYPADGESGFTATWTVVAPDAAPAPAVVPPVIAPVPPVTNRTTDRDGDGIQNTWLIGGKPATAPSAPKATITAKGVTLKLPAAAKTVKAIRIYRADGKGAYTLVKTVSRKGGTLVDGKIKPGHTYHYKTVAVNAKGQQSKASKAVSAKIHKK